MSDKNTRLTILIFAAIAVLCTALTFTRTAQSADLAVSDWLYQHGNVSSGDIVIIEIDEASMEKLGGDPQSWDRSVYNRLFEQLCKSKDTQPAVIGIDVVFAYERDAATDAELAGAAQNHGKVVTGKILYYGTDLETDPQGGYVWQPHAVVDSTGPYAELADSSCPAVVNIGADDDGIVRHSSLSYTDETGETVPSFAFAVAERFAEYKGAEFIPPDQNRIYLDFTYKSGGYLQSISLADVLDGAYEPETFAGKIVLVGSTASAMKDHYLTASDHGAPMNGVEIHANIIEQLLRGDIKHEVSDGIQRLLTLLILLIGALAFLRLSPAGMAAAWAVLSAGYMFICSRLYSSGTVVHPLWAPAGLTVMLAVATATRFLREAAERRAIRQQFGKYVDPRILEQILSGEAEMVNTSGTQRNIAVLFVDICGFTSLSEKLPAEEVVVILNRYLDMVTECIMRNEGTLDKFIGDCAMAFWNAPLEQENAVFKAVQAAREMLGEADRLREELGYPLNFAIGIHCGEAVVGNIGSSKRLDFTAIGDTVNTASRLESLKIQGRERGREIYVSEEVNRALAGLAETEYLGEHHIKGKEEPVRVYRIAG